ncbi:MAG: muramoyltetrapeptide carboxypeptidase [Thermoanaerobaculia bacterium]|jgi:muramoyltetrapeptide carboxypeptidase|nr:muramoyltetrapeptide carboxypeptidase [Thermoanaerobaculia bacterium]
MSSPSELQRIEAAARTLEARGLRVTLAANIDHRHRGYLAGDDGERLRELNHYLRSDEIDAFFFARGGYGAMRILDGIDYESIVANPRPIVGFSDITALHQAIAVRCGVAGFHGPMLNLDWAEGLSAGMEEWFWSMLGGDAPLTHRFDRTQVVFEGEVEGVLFGGCLSLTTALTATPYDFWIDDGIWFFEDVDEPVYRIDRMLTHLRLTGRLNKIRAVVIGKLKGCGSDAEIEALLHEFFGSSNIPVIRDLPFGHHGDNLLMPVGLPVRVSTRDLTLTFAQPAVQR